jgi:hypothetical protein
MMLVEIKYYNISQAKPEICVGLHADGGDCLNERRQTE